jgi:hypothetical protein
MPRTPIPEHLIHRPADVERDAERFDHLCGLAEEISYPIVKEALIRETAATGAEVLTDEAKQALQMLAEDAGEELSIAEEEILEAVQKSFKEQLSPAEEPEWRQHAKDLSQVLISEWLDNLRTAHRTSPVLVLSDYLLPQDTPNSLERVMEWFGKVKTKLPETLTDAVATFAVNDDDVAEIMCTLRVKLFTRPLLVDLPFNLVMFSAPDQPVQLMARSLYDRLVAAITEHLQKQRKKIDEILVVGVGASVAVAAAPPEAPLFRTATAQRAVDSLTHALSPNRYACVAKVAATDLKIDTLQTQVTHVLRGV